MGFLFYITIHKLQEIINNITKIKQKTNKNTLTILKGEGTIKTAYMRSFLIKSCMDNEVRMGIQ